MNSFNNNNTIISLYYHTFIVEEECHRNALFSCVLNASYYFFELRRNWCGTGIASATPFFAPNLIMGVWRPICSCLPHYSRKGHTWYAYLPACDFPIISQFRSLVSTDPIIVCIKILHNINIINM